jgi:hypothetical protein
MTLPWIAVLTDVLSATDGQTIATSPPGSNTTRQSTLLWVRTMRLTSPAVT